VIENIQEDENYKKKSPAKWQGSLRLWSDPLNLGHDLHVLEFEGKP